MPILVALLWSGLSFAMSPETRDAVALGDCESVAAALPAPSSDEERLALGWCLRSSDPARAIEVLTDLGDGVLAEYGLFVRADALLAQGRPTEALASIEGLSLPGDVGIDLRLIRARALLALDRSLDARPDLRALLDTAAADEARVLLSDGAVQRGDVQPAIDTYRRAWATSVRGPWSDTAAQALAALNAPVPDFSTEDGRALVRDRLAALKKAQRHGEVYTLETALREATGDTKTSWALGESQFRARQYPAAIETFTAATGGNPASLNASRLFQYALTHGRVGDYAGATKHYQTLLRTHPSSKEADQASYKIGYMAADEGRCEDAIRELGRHLRERPSSKYADEARWFSARCQWLAGDIDAADKSFQQLLAASPRSSLAPGATYWRARAHGARGDADKERAALEALLKAWPESGHAWFAAERLGRSFDPVAVVARPPWPDALAKTREVRRAEALLAAGFGPWARVELAKIKSIAPKHGRAGALAAAHAFIAMGDYRAGQALARPYCVSPWKGGSPDAQQACHPRPESSIVERTAAKYGLHPLLPYGIMISESAMKPWVTSIAGARGLMQIMPAEGGRLHAAAFNGRDGYDPDFLYLAPYNALLGTTELGLKLQSLDGMLEPNTLPAAIASYNAGEEAVRRWIGAYEEQPVPFDTFSEAIGYTETRRYVRGVLGNLMTYRWVYGDPN